MTLKRTLPLLSWGFLILFSVFCLATLARNHLAHASPWEHHLETTLALPSSLDWLGFDAFGRPLTQLLAACALQSLSIAFTVVVLSIASAILFSSLMIALPRRPQKACVRLLEWLLAFPTLLLALGIAAYLGASRTTLILSLTVGTVPSLIRLFYLKSQETLAEPYILASRILGGRPYWIAHRHLAPALGSVIVLCIPGLLAHTIIAESTLSFIGIGVGASYESWGTLLAQAKDYLIEAPHIAWSVGTPLFLTLLSLQFLTEGSRFR